MKGLLKTLVLSSIAIFSATASAEYCTTVIREYKGPNYTYEYDNFTRTSYSTDAACSDAMYDCQRRLSDYQSRGLYYNAQCAVKSNSYPSDPRPPSYPTYPSYPSYPSYPPSYPSYPPRDPYPSYPPRDPYPSYPPGRDPHYPGRDPHYPGRDPGRDPGRFPPGREPSYPGHPPAPRDPADDPGRYPGRNPGRHPGRR